MIYLDNAASSHPKPPAVCEAVSHWVCQGANPGRAGHSASLEGVRRIRVSASLSLSPSQSVKIFLDIIKSLPMNAGTRL